MESNRGQSGGIQLLLSAEQEAQHVVNAARSGKWSNFYLEYSFISIPTRRIDRFYELYGLELPRI